MYKLCEELQDYFHFSAELFRRSVDPLVRIFLFLHLLCDRFIETISIICLKVFNYSSLALCFYVYRRDKFVSFVQCSTFCLADYHEFL